MLSCIVCRLCRGACSKTFLSHNVHYILGCTDLQPALRRPAYNPIDCAPLSSSSPPAANGSSNCDSTSAANSYSHASQAPPSTGSRSSAPELSSKPKVTSQYVPPAKRVSSAGMLTRRSASDSGSAAPTIPAKRTPPPGFQVPGNAQRWHNRSISAGSSAGGRSSAPPAAAACIARPRDSVRVSAAGSAAPTGWQNSVVNGGGSSKPYATRAGAAQHQVMVTVARGCSAVGLHALSHMVWDQLAV